ncbi:MAG: hypothetical protein Sapg2KO_13630 [Saprospiraceae bacterium]
MQKQGLLIFLLFLFTVSLSAQSKVSKDILFVGNSYTYFWNLPQVVAQMAVERDIAITTRQSTSGGTNLGQHYRGAKALKSVELIQSGDFNIVVLQDHSRRAIDAPDSLMYYGALLGEMVKKSGAQPYVYLTWARQWDPSMQDPITKEYMALAKKINAKVVPVGLAWEKAREINPHFPLYDQDQSHPSSLGTYLSACVFFAVMTDQSPVGLPNRLITTDKDGEKFYLTIQSKADALFCQQIAEQVVAEMK